MSSVVMKKIAWYLISLGLTPAYDTSIPSIWARSYYLQLIGDSDENKLTILNLCLMHYVYKYKKKTIPLDIP